MNLDAESLSFRIKIIWSFTTTE